MADLSFLERHVLRQLISKGHDQCVPHAQMREEVLKSLEAKGLMESSMGDPRQYRLTPAGKLIQLKDLR